MVTTIQISESLRNDLLELKQNSKKSYEDIISNLLKKYKQEQEGQKNLLIEGYKEMANLNLEMTKEWEDIDLKEIEKIEY